MVVGSVGLAKLSPPLRKVERRLGGEVNVTSYSAGEFRTKTLAKDHFLSQVLRGPKDFVKGNEDDLDALVRKRGSGPDFPRPRRVLTVPALSGAFAASSRAFAPSGKPTNGVS